MLPSLLSLLLSFPPIRPLWVPGWASGCWHRPATQRGLGGCSSSALGAMLARWRRCTVIKSRAERPTEGWLCFALSPWWHQEGAPNALASVPGMEQGQAPVDWLTAEGRVCGRAVCVRAGAMCPRPGVADFIHVVVTEGPFAWVLYMARWGQPQGPRGGLGPGDCPGQPCPESDCSTSLGVTCPLGTSWAWPLCSPSGVPALDTVPPQ